MNLISQIFLIILIACFTGTVSLGFWRVFQPLLLKRDPRLVYATLRFVCMMYIVPFGYLIVRLTWRGYLRADGIWKPNFEMAGDMDLVFGIAGIIWLIFLIKNVADGVIEFIRWKRLCRYRIPVADEQVLAEFGKENRVYEKICESQKRGKNISICTVVFICGNFNDHNLCSKLRSSGCA